MKKYNVFISAILLLATCTLFAQNKEYAGNFEAEGKYYDTRFVRVIFNAEGSEKEGESNSIEPIVYESKNLQGNTVKVRRFQIVTKNTGYDEIKTAHEEDYKLKKVENGAKIHIEVPLGPNGDLQLYKAYVGNLAYNFGTRESRHQLEPDAVSDIHFDLKTLNLPKFGNDSKPGDKGIIHNQGYVKFDLTCKAKHIDSNQVSEFKVHVDSPISITHIRGKERAGHAVMIDPAIVASNH